MTGADLLGRADGFGVGLAEGLADGVADGVAEGLGLGLEDSAGEVEVGFGEGLGATEEGDGLAGADSCSTLIAGPKFTGGGADNPMATT